ncbi:hypothetical protein CCACVL1_30462 [Corchorus capsularis]|uniref:Cyclin N-terminal domain-containing protein n=1 Tax=Corchorus capsularis TaxID=210143 RepID=A0A1R3FX31_COCAP|nr:hypothetical protein CCACVL1_30462 [Corchorus capsularis]
MYLQTPRVRIRYRHPEAKENNNVYIAQQIEEEGKICKRNLLLEMDSNDNDVAVYIDCKEPHFCAHIAHAIYKNLRSSEAKRMPCADFMETIQKDINARMRAVLIDWLVQVTIPNVDTKSEFEYIFFKIDGKETVDGRESKQEDGYWKDEISQEESSS